MNHRNFQYPQLRRENDATAHTRNEQKSKFRLEISTLNFSAKLWPSSATVTHSPGVWSWSQSSPDVSDCACTYDFVYNEYYVFRANKLCVGVCMCLFVCGFISSRGELRWCTRHQ